ncbi:unnamed protein product [Candidula unifasciata]|uniref:WAPL domain-containing protein n=1 Tax=Candidula unifasciata TaxID=100452 RepID=A0A8S3ZIP1_9EUPU|nr:unnamed protein product [Candidula unifasciata]
MPVRRSARLQNVSALVANSKETMPVRRSARLQNVSALVANSKETMPVRRSVCLQNVSALAANSKDTAPSSDGSAITLQSVNPSSTKHATSSRHSKVSVTGSATSSSPLSKAGNVLTGRSSESSQVFRSYAPQMHTVVQNVKQSHKVQELGETRDFVDDVGYLLDSLQDTNPTSVRCLSCLKLASKCLSPSFRKHLRAHGTVTKIVSRLHDACSEPCLALSTSAMMFLLSRDSLNMDLDEDSLTLMVRLSEADTVEHHYLDTSALKELKNFKQKVKELLTHLPQEKHAGKIDLGFVSTGNLAMESLLSLTLKRADEWFNEWSPWGLGRIVDFLTDCEHSLPEDISQATKKTLPVLKKLNRCLKFLTKISSINFDSQNYLISYKNAAFVQACIRILQRCQTYMPSYNVLKNVEKNKALKHFPGYKILICMMDVLMVLDTLTFESEAGNLDLKIETSLMQTIVRCLTTTHCYVPVEKRFELELLCLSLLRTLVEHKECNRQILMSPQMDVKYTEKSQPKTMSGIKAVVELFVQREEAARQTEDDNQSILENENETFTKAFGKAGRPVNYLFVASYAGLLLGFTIVNNKEYATAVKKLMPNKNFDLVIKRLKKFLNFYRITAFCNNIAVNLLTKVIRILQTA